VIPKCNYSYLGVLVFIFLNLGIQNFVKAQSHLSKEGELIQNHWTRKDGLPEWLIPFIFEDSRGLIWLGFNTSVYTFDGLNFRKIFEIIPEVLIEEIKGISEDMNGKIWILKKSNKSFSIHVFDPISENILTLKEYAGTDLPGEISKGVALDLFYNFNQSIWLGIDGIIYNWNGSFKKYYQGGTWENLSENWKPGKEGTGWVVDFQKETTYLLYSC